MVLEVPKKNALPHMGYIHACIHTHTQAVLGYRCLSRILCLDSLVGPIWGHANHEGGGGSKDLDGTYMCAEFQPY